MVANKVPGSLGRLLLQPDNIQKLNNITTNEGLVSFLQSVDTDSLDEEGIQYLQDLIKTIQSGSRGSFGKNYTHVYNIILAGDGLAAI